MGFMGMADGGRIKEAVNCGGSAKFMRRARKTMQICRNRRVFLFQVSIQKRTPTDSVCANCGVIFVGTAKMHQRNFRKEVLLFIVAVVINSRGNVLGLKVSQWLRRSTVTR